MCLLHAVRSLTNVTRQEQGLKHSVHLTNDNKGRVCCIRVRLRSLMRYGPWLHQRVMSGYIDTIKRDPWEEGRQWNAAGHYVHVNIISLRVARINRKFAKFKVGEISICGYLNILLLKTILYIIS